MLNELRTGPTQSPTGVSIALQEAVQKINEVIRQSNMQAAAPVNWDSILGKPATFAPSAHKTRWTDITGKPSLDFSGSYEPLGAVDAAIAAHLADSDPHPQYLTGAEGASAFEPIGAVAAAIASHLAAADPHTQYLNNARGDAKYDAIGAAATAESNADAYTDTSIGDLLLETIGTFKSKGSIFTASGSGSSDVITPGTVGYPLLSAGAGSYPIYQQIANDGVAAAAAIAWSKISKTGALPADVGASAAVHTHTAADIVSGTLALAQGGTASDNTSRTANTGFMGPASGGAGNAVWRALVAADIPVIGYSSLPSVGGTWAAAGGTVTLQGLVDVHPVNVAPVVRLTGDGVVGGTGYSGELRFYDNTTLGARFTAVFSGTGSARAMQFIGQTDRDGNRLFMQFLVHNAAGVSTEGMRLLAGADAGSVVFGPLSALSTTATAGFVYIPRSAGAPTGVPSAVTGKVPMQYDTTNNKLWVYNGAWKSVVLT